MGEITVLRRPCTAEKGDYSTQVDLSSSDGSGVAIRTTVTDQQGSRDMMLPTIRSTDPGVLGKNAAILRR